MITPTAEIHERAWADLFAAYDYTAPTTWPTSTASPGTTACARSSPRATSCCPRATPDDAPGDDTVCALGNRKNALFNEILERDGIAPYPGSQRTLDLLERSASPAAIVSSSKNARPVLEAAGLADRFDVVVDGVVVAARGLPGKPAPDAYLLGAELLGVDPARTVVVEDAVSGVAAGAAGSFGVVIGVDRGAGAEALIAHGADVRRRRPRRAARREPSAIDREPINRVPDRAARHIASRSSRGGSSSASTPTTTSA